ncbi:MAG TPA: potassium channel protein [Longimicrobium sp.]|nr:potassium channel protein [Longimicrobium sp.]
MASGAPPRRRDAPIRIPVPRRLTRPAAQPAVDRRRRPRKTPLSYRLRAAAEDPLRRLQLALVVLGLLVAIGTLFYRYAEGMGWINALYMTVITVATVGFGETEALSQGGRLFTVGLIVVGVAAGAWAAGNAIEVMLGQTFWLTVQRRKMNQTLPTLRDHFIVCGYGRLGTRIVRDLMARGETFVVVDEKQELEEGFLADAIPHVIGDATHDEVLMAAGVARARGVVVALDADANNVLTVLTARGLNPKLLIVSRSNSETSEGKLRRAGADRVVTPEDIGGHRLALALLRPAVHDLFDQMFSFSVDVAVDVGQITIGPHSPFAGQTIAGCDLRRVMNVSILAVRASGGEFTLNPHAQHQIAPGETLIVIGPAEAVYELEALYEGE